MPPQHPEITIRSKIKSPEKAINTGMLLARKNIEYTLADIGEGKWKISLTRGTVNDLLSIIKTTTSIEIVHDSKPPESMDVDLDF